MLEAGNDEDKARGAAENARWYKKEGSFWVPRESRYAYLLNEAHHNVGVYLNNALTGIETANTSLHDVLEHISPALPGCWCARTFDVPDGAARKRREDPKDGRC